MAPQGSAQRERLLAGLVGGGACGALVGLVAFGGIVYVPVLAMFAGGLAGLVVAARSAGVRSSLGELLERVFDGEGQAPEPEFFEPRDTSRSAGASRARSPSRAAARARAPIRPPTGPPPPLPPDRDPIDINTAGVDELTELPGVVAPAAARIVAYRDAHGPYGSLRDLERVWGFDAERVAYLAAWTTLHDGEPAASSGAAEAGPAVPA
jgi:competence protein ComEA